MTENLQECERCGKMKPDVTYEVGDNYICLDCYTSRIDAASDAFWHGDHKPPKKE